MRFLPMLRVFRERGAESAGRENERAVTSPASSSSASSAFSKTSSASSACATSPASPIKGVTASLAALSVDSGRRRVNFDLHDGADDDSLDDEEHPAFLPLLPGSSSSSAASSCESLCPRSVRETHHVSTDYDPVSGHKTINAYEILRELGRGQHGKVKLARDLTCGDLVAIKIMARTERPRLGRPARRGSTQEDNVRREIAILKRCDHPHIVRLREVLDDSSRKKIFLVLEYAERGEIRWQCDGGGPAMSVARAREVFSDVVCGVDYLHRQGIIHRDLKPANLLVAANGAVKLSDFGVSYLAGLAGEDDDFELAKTAGTPAFFAPELCWNDIDKPRPVITNKIDIWALGVTLYCLLYGCCPFMAENEFELFQVIATEEVVYPAEPAISDACRDLLASLLAKDPDARPAIADVRAHPWLRSAPATATAIAPEP
ncbi:kinase-like domain-containing protein [Dipodascopsis tothii]|uniref:kinase-like domain-containing protein n=1 Tax=Dipodascopsis tothii TaxID=44089 RepID=UPI0034D00085